MLQSMSAEKQKLGFLTKGFKLWSGCSPDLNPIENLWGILPQRVYSESRQFSKMNELKDALFKEWLKIDDNLVANLFGSIQSRIEKVIRLACEASIYAT